MTITINPFVAGVLCTIASEIIAFVLLIFFIALRSSLKSRRNASK